MPVPSFDIFTFIKLWIPPNYRKPKFMAATQSFLSGLAWKNGIFDAYMNGDPQPTYDGTITYNTGNAVQYNFSTYESLTDSNTGNQPDISPDAWTIRCKSFIGATERAKYNGRYLNLTYELNRYFGQQIATAGLTGFRQPPYPAPYDFGLGVGTFSDIYITNDPIVDGPFVTGIDSAESSVVGVSTGTDYVPVAPTYVSSSSYGFVINVPAAVYAMLGATTAIRNSIINTFVARYAPSGTHWRIVTY